MIHLWEAEHDYYCNEGNYSMNGAGHNFNTLDEFLDEWGDSDMDMNLVFRWDWNEDNGFNGDVNYRNGVLLVFVMGQRKGHYQWCEVSVCRADEQKAINFLRPRMEHLIKLWEPLSL